MNLKQLQGILGVVLVASVCLIALVATSDVKAQSLMIGQLQPINAPLCKKQKDMEDVARMDSKKGIPAAKALLAKKKDCAYGAFMGVVTGITLTLPTARGKTVRVLAVQVEMADGSKQTFYVLTDADFDDLKAT